MSEIYVIYPVLIGEDGLLDGIKKLLHGRRRHAEPLSPCLHTKSILVWPEKLDLPVFLPVCL